MNRFRSVFFPETCPEDFQNGQPEVKSADIPLVKQNIRDILGPVLSVPAADQNKMRAEFRKYSEIDRGEIWIIRFLHGMNFA